MHPTKPPRRNIRRTRGSALITVTLIGLFVMLLAAALVNSFAIAEANAVADSLAKTRIYWASMGHINYGLSRISREGLCGGACANDDGRVTDLRTYFAELNSATNLWDYGGGYNFKMTASVIDGPDPTPIDNDGRVRATIELVPIAETPFDTLNGIEQRIRGKLVVDICLGVPCGSPTSSGENRIEALRRQN